MLGSSTSFSLVFPYYNVFVTDVFLEFCIRNIIRLCVCHSQASEKKLTYNVQKCSVVSKPVKLNSWKKQLRCCFVRLVALQYKTVAKLNRNYDYTNIYCWHTDSVINQITFEWNTVIDSMNQRNIRRPVNTTRSHLRLYGLVASEVHHDCRHRFNTFQCTGFVSKDQLCWIYHYVYYTYMYIVQMPMSDVFVGCIFPGVQSDMHSIGHGHASQP